MDFHLLSQYVLSGLVIGVIYSLMALGITFIYSIMKMINWSMGEFYMIGSYVQYALLASVLGWDRWYLALPLAMGSVFVLGLIVQRVLLRPMYVGGVERRDALQDGSAGRRAAQQAADLVVAESGRELGEDAQVGGHAGCHQGEEGMHGLPVDGIEGHRLPQQAEGHERPRHLQQDRVAGVGDGNAVADPGRAHRLAGLEHREQEVPIQLGRQREERHHLPQHVGFRAARNVVMDASRGQQLRQRRRLLRLASRLVEQLSRHREPLLHRPLPELDGVAVQPLVDRMGGQTAVGDPAAHRRFRDLEVGSGLAQSDVHAEGRWRADLAVVGGGASGGAK